MFLNVFYTLRLIDDFNEKKLNLKRSCVVQVPDELQVNEFHNYVVTKYYDKIFNLEKYSNGSLELSALSIDYVEYTTLLKVD